MSDFFRNLAEDLKDEDTSIAADGMGSAEYTGTVDTGSYISVSYTHLTLPTKA